ncbi:MAG: phosphoribosylamine--glycine ligase [Planctomycetes bacterium]|nr:phosphoribosylamine--glycine ligase [Planctomycetota bacterium]MBI3844561.1 phosphoribosylamine--glycine ligase [Planctomycetota bacterium]
MKVLVVGSGGREHALVWKIRQSPRTREVLCAPGNAGIASIARCVDVSADDPAKILALAVNEGVDLTIVGPEALLCAGIVDLFQEKGLRIFGPTRKAAMLEGSKVWAKKLMNQYRIPTAAFRAFAAVKDARDYIRSRSSDQFPVVVKASGLASGKGVVICPTEKEATAAVLQIMEERRFGDAGSEIVIEEFLKGEEASILALTDGKTIAVLETAQDYKQALTGDRGPNTGGMGAYSPAPVVTPKIARQVDAEVLVPLVHAMYREGCKYKGLLYAGLMITKSGPKVLEFNVRFGDPETQPLMMRLRTDLIDLIEAVIDGKLDQVEMDWDPRPAVCVVMASRGYPEKYDTGQAIHGLDTLAGQSDVQVFHAGTARRNNQLVTAGGRVLGVTALGKDFLGAKERAYAAVRAISFDRCHYRTDIGDRAVIRDLGD